MSELGYKNLIITHTVPCKCKLTVPRNLNFVTRSSKLERFEYPGASRVHQLSRQAENKDFSRDKFFICLIRGHSSVPFYRNQLCDTANCVCVFVGAMCARVCTRMIEMERVRSLSVFSVPCRLQPKVLSVFNQENAVFEVLIRKIKVQPSIILCMQRTGLAGLKAIARVSILSL